MKKKYCLVIFLTVLLVTLSITTSLASQLEQRDGIVKIIGDIHISEDLTVTGDVVSIIGDVKVDGTVEGDVISIIGDVEANKQIDGDAVAIIGDLKINNDIGGDLVSILGNISLAPNANVSGEITEISAFEFSGVNFTTLGFFNWTFKIMGLIIFFALTVLVFILLPKQEHTMAKKISENPLRVFLVGLISFILIPFTSFALIISIIGILLMPVFILTLVVLSILGQVAIALAIGKRISKVAKLDITVIVELLAGTLILWAIKQIPLLGSLISLVIFIFSLGVVIDTKFGTNKPWFKNQTTKKE